MNAPMDVKQSRLDPKHNQNDKLNELLHKIKNVQILTGSPLYGFVLFTSIALISTFVGMFKGKGLEEAGLWVNIGFWGGFGLAFLFMLDIIVVALIQTWKLEKLNDKLEKEMARLGYEPFSRLGTDPLREMFQNCIRSSRRVLGLPVPTRPDPVEITKKIEGDHLLQLQHKLKTWRHPNPLYQYTGQLLAAFGSISSIIRWHKDWKYEELGFWFYLCNFGGYIVGSTLTVIGLWFSYRNRRDFDATLQEFKEERARRGLEPRSMSDEIETHQVGTC